MVTDKHAQSMSEREWIGAAVRRRRTELGLRQKDAAALLSAAGLHVSQQVLAKIEAGDKLLEVGELLVVCFVLDTTLVELLFPVVTDGSGQSRADEEVTPQLVRFSTGRELPTGYLHAVLVGERIDGALVEFEDRNASKRASVVSVPDVLDLRSEYVGDPAAVAVGELLELDASEVTELVRQHSRKLLAKLGLPTIARRKLTATDVLEALFAKWKREHPEGPGVSEELGQFALRQVRTALTRMLAAALEEVIGR